MGLLARMSLWLVRTRALSKEKSTLKLKGRVTNVNDGSIGTDIVDGSKMMRNRHGGEDIDIIEQKKSESVDGVRKVRMNDDGMERMTWRGVLIGSAIGITMMIGRGVTGMEIAIGKDMTEIEISIGKDVTRIASGSGNEIEIAAPIHDIEITVPEENTEKGEIEIIETTLQTIELGTKKQTKIPSTISSQSPIHPVPAMHNIFRFHAPCLFLSTLALLFPQFTL
jgi:hypothetical protein